MESNTTTKHLNQNKMIQLLNALIIAIPLWVIAFVISKNKK